MKKLWVIELRFDHSGEWRPTVGVAISRGEAKDVLADWQKRNPNDKFRVAAYERRPR